MNITNLLWLFPRISESFITFPLVALEARGHVLRIMATQDPRHTPASEDLARETVTHARLRSSHLLERTTYQPDVHLLYGDLLQIAKQTQVFLVHWSDYIDALLSWPPLPRPVVMSCHEPDFSRHFLPAFQRHPEALLARIVAVMTETHAQRVQLLACGFPADRVQVWQAGVDTAAIREAIDATPTRTRLQTPIQLLSVGRYVEKKGFLEAIGAVHLLRQQSYDVQYHLVGEGVQLSHYQQCIHTHRLNGVVCLHGKQPHPQLYRTLASADMLLAPSHATNDDQEGIMSILLEAMACGLPIISSTHGGTSEVLHHRMSGLLLDQVTPETIAAAVRELIETPALWSYLRQQATVAVQQHDLDRRITQLEALLQHVISHDPRRP